jgi:hypothetical protein
VGRLLRLIARQGYHVEIHLRCIPNRFAKPHPVPTVTVVRYNGFGLPVPLDA